MQWHKSEAGFLLLKVAGVYLLWYLIYELYLLPKGSFDQWINTNIVSVSAGILEMLGYDFYAAGRLIGIGESAGIYLVDGGSGISTIGLFVGFMIAYPGVWIPRIAFIFTGIGVLYLVNIIRIIVLTIIQRQASEIVMVTHDYATTAIFYLVIFALGVVWVNFGDRTRVAGV
ncbi:archaeosortase/exosortase family protein [Fodinibius sp. AD559]|uniref:archaeosortase/exosortase family protein n=1 Tax=Fodinibius sp. AD559 TaxID=3424179 RepID=UPI004046B2ED